MRRLLSILLLAAFMLPLIAPLLAFAQDPDATLPACCRRHGQHHCTMADAGRNNSAPRFVAVCSMWPQRAVPASVVSPQFTGRPSLVAITLNIVELSAIPIPHRSVTAPERLHPKRGPPTTSLAIA